MPRDRALEALVSDQLMSLTGLETRAMFGGLCWMWRGHLLCGAGSRGIMVRLGPSPEPWTRELPGVEPARMGTRVMGGWFRLGPEAYVVDDLRDRLFHAAIAYVRSLPSKPPGAPSPRPKRAAKP